jgi:hypothetical protein
VSTLPSRVLMMVGEEDKALPMPFVSGSGLLCCSGVALLALLEIGAAGLKDEGPAFPVD